MKMVKIRENTWINPDHVKYVRYDALKKLTTIQFGMADSESITVPFPLENVIKTLTGQDVKEEKKEEKK